MGAPVPKEKELHRIAVTGIVWKEEEEGKRTYLITRRSPDKKVFPGKWTVPGGGLETGDYPGTEPTYPDDENPQWYHAVETALRREIKEETGIAVTDIRFLTDLAFIRPDGIPVVVLSFYCRYDGGDVSLDEDSVEFAWVSADEVGDYDLIQGIDEEIREVDRLLRD